MVSLLPYDTKPLPALTFRGLESLEQVEVGQRGGRAFGWLACRDGLDDFLDGPVALDLGREDDGRI